MEFHLLSLVICSLFAYTYSFPNPDNFALTDKVGQGNFAYAKMFAFGDDGVYRLIKRSSFYEPQKSNTFAINGIRNKFAKHRGTPNSEFAFAFAKRSAPVLRTFAIVGDSQDPSNDFNSNFARFNKRDVNVDEFAKFARK